MLTNLPRLHALLDEEGLAAVVGTSPENVTYLSGFWAMSQWVRRGPQAYALQPAAGQGHPVVVADSGVLDLIADQDIWVKDIRRYGFFKVEVDPDASLDEADRLQAKLFESRPYEDPVEALAAAISEQGMARARIGIDETGITPRYMAQLREALPDATFVDAYALLQKTRAVKTPREIERLRISASIAEGAIEAALSIAAEGVTERDMLRALNGHMVRHDALPVVGCLGFGPRSAMINAQPSHRPLRPGDVIRFDIGGRFEHYRSDISRIACFGEIPSPRIAKYHRALEVGVLKAYEILRPGLKVGELFDQVVEAVRREGIPHYNRSHVGHGIGIDGYDPPNVAHSSAEVIEQDMVLCIETPYYELGFAGLQVEDMLRVTADGVETLMTLDTSLRVLPQ